MSERPPEITSRPHVSGAPARTDGQGPCPDLKGQRPVVETGLGHFGSDRTFWPGEAEPHPDTVAIVDDYDAPPRPPCDLLVAARV